MQWILLSSAAIVAFAGAAAADVDFTGSATLGYNDDIKGGVYADSDFDIKMSQELANGWTAALSYGFELEKLEDGDLDGFNSGDGNLAVSLSNDSYSLTYGDTEFAAKEFWSGTPNMQNDNFSEQDGEEVLKVKGMFGGVEAAISSNIDTDSGDLDQAQFGAKATFGSVDVIAVYQDDASGDADYGDDFKEDAAFGIAVSTTVAGADVKVAHADDGKTSTGISVSYPVGDVALTAFYTSEEVGDDNYGLEAKYAANGVAVKAWFHDGQDEDYGVNVSYDVSEELSIYAGYSDDDGQYVGAGYDLGGGAALTVSYAEDEDSAGNDEIGPQEYLHGSTVALSLKF